MKKDIYIFTSGELKRKDNTLFFDGENGKRYIPVEETDNIWVFGEVTLNKHFLDFASQKEISVHFYNYYGYYSGSFYPREHLNSGHVILKQAEYYMDDGKRLDIARRIVQASLKNLVVVLKYYNARGMDLNISIDRISSFIKQTDYCDTIDELMAYEGNSRDLYYSEFNTIIKNSDFEFKIRSRRPPKDRINALISFGNSALYTTVLGEIYNTYLDPRIGFLHATNARRFSLNLDIADIFKPVMVDRVIFTLLNKSIITKKDFVKEMGGIILKDDARKRFIQEVNNKLAAVIKHPKLNMNVSYKRLIRLELYKLQKHIMNDELYEGFVAKW